MDSRFAAFCETLVTIGDEIETDVMNPYPHTLRMRIETPAACAEANNLIMSGRWRKRLTLSNAPVGTLAPAIMGGHWCKMEHGWKWNGPDGSGSTFPRPGGDWNGKLVPPSA